MTEDEREMLMEMPAVRELVRQERAAEREACARVALGLPFWDYQMNDCRSDDIAAAIRARTQ